MYEIIKDYVKECSYIDTTALPRMDASIQVADGKVTGIDYDHCKGCGICSKECKFGAITMEAEKK